MNMLRRWSIWKNKKLIQNVAKRWRELSQVARQELITETECRQPRKT